MTISARSVFTTENDSVEDAEWLGVVAWGELYPVCGKAGFHNYAFPMLVLAD